MKVKKLIIKNIGIIENETIELDKPLILFYGDIKQGKTTILNAVKWLFGGSYPTDIVRHGQTEASVKMLFDNGSITREWYVNKEGATNDRSIVFILDGEPVKKPVKEIEKFLNPYLLDNEFFKKMGETERKKYLPELFQVDTSEIDKDLAKTESEARDLRSKLKGYGEIDTTEVKPVDLTALQTKLEKTRETNRKALSDITQKNLAVITHNGAVDTTTKEVATLEEEIKDLSTQINDLKTKMGFKMNQVDEKKKWLTANPRKQQSPTPNPIPTDDIEKEISDGSATNARYDQYQKNSKRAADKKADEKALSDLETKGRTLKAQKVAKLKTISDTCGIPGLVFDETGNFTYDGTQAGMLSTSQIMKLSGELSALYPQGFGLELIDRAESLGKSIFGFIERAQKEDKSILATIVGERPAKVPEEVGVWVVEDGKVKA